MIEQSEYQLEDSLMAQMQDLGYGALPLPPRRHSLPT